MFLQAEIVMRRVSRDYTLCRTLNTFCILWYCFCRLKQWWEELLWLCNLPHNGKVGGYGNWWLHCVSIFSVTATLLVGVVVVGGGELIQLVVDEEVGQHVQWDPAAMCECLGSVFGISVWKNCVNVGGLTLWEKMWLLGWTFWWKSFITVGVQILMEKLRECLGAKFTWKVVWM